MGGTQQLISLTFHSIKFMKKKTPSRPSIKVGVVGYGGAFNMGKAHLTEMQAAGMTPVAVTEIDPARLGVATSDFPGIQTFGTLQEMLAKSDVELVTIITPHNTHAVLALECLRAGRHVVCEKPMAITTAECDAMITAAKKRDLVISTYHNRHWDGWILRAVEEIRRKKKIGDVFRIDLHMGRRGLPGDWWRSSRSISGGILYDWGVHLLEYALQLMDSEITEVSGYAKEGFWAPQTKWKDDTNEDEASAVVRFSNGSWVNLCVTSLDVTPPDGIMNVHGTKGNYLIRTDGYTLSTIEDGVLHQESGPNPKSEGYRFYKNVAGHITRGERLVITPEWSRRPIHILDLAARSAKSGKAIAAKYG